VCPVGRFFLSPRAKRRKKRSTGSKEERQRARGEGPRGGQGECQTALSFGAQRCCPEGPSRSEAEWSPSPVRVDKRRGGQAQPRTCFCLAESGNWNTGTAENR